MKTRIVVIGLCSLLAAALVAACSGKPPAEEGRAAPFRRGAPAPAAPIRLDLEAPAQAPAGQPLTLEARISTPLKTGLLEVKVVGQQGVTLLADPFARFDLASAQQPLPLTLELLPEAASQRYLVLLVTIETDEAMPLVRSFRIALPDGEETPQSPSRPADGGLKLLPSTPAR